MSKRSQSSDSKHFDIAAMRVLSRTDVFADWSKGLKFGSPSTDGGSTRNVGGKRDRYSPLSGRGNGSINSDVMVVIVLVVVVE